jgi:hypothetical protein
MVQSRFVSESDGRIMQIGDISKIASSTAEWVAAQSQSKPANSVASTSVSETAPISSSASAKSSSSSEQTQNGVSSLQVTTAAATYSAIGAGKNYAGSVEQLGETFVASVPNPPGISASGSSVVAAETKLNIKLDELA